MNKIVLMMMLFASVAQAGGEYKCCVSMPWLGVDQCFEGCTVVFKPTIPQRGGDYYKITVQPSDNNSAISSENNCSYCGEVRLK